MTTVDGFKNISHRLLKSNMKYDIEFIIAFNNFFIFLEDILWLPNENLLIQNNLAIFQILLIIQSVCGSIKQSIW